MSAESIFSEAGAGKQEGLRHFWPELHAALSGQGPDAAPRPAPWCPICTRTETPAAAKKRATGRLTFNGTPACPSCIARSSDRPGGYPLELQERPRSPWR